MLDSFMSLKTLLISETVQYYVGLLGNLNFNICRGDRGTVAHGAQ